MEKNEKEINKNRKARQSRRLLKGSPLFIVLLIAAVLTSAVLITTYLNYESDMTGDISLTGKTSNLKFDGELIASETFIVEMDVTAMTNGDSETFTHTAEFLTGDNTNWYDVAFDFTPITEPTNEFYGFGFSIWDSTETTELTNINNWIKQGEPATEFVFKYELNDNFQHTENPLSFALGIDFIEHVNLPPVVSNEITATVSNAENRHTAIEILPLCTILDPEGHTYTLTGTGTFTGDGSINIKDNDPDLWTLDYYTGSGYPSEGYAEFYITDELGAIGIGICNILVS